MRIKRFEQEGRPVSRIIVGEFKTLERFARTEDEAAIQPKLILNRHFPSKSINVPRRSTNSETFAVFLKAGKGGPCGFYARTGRAHSAIAALNLAGSSNGGSCADFSNQTSFLAGALSVARNGLAVGSTEGRRPSQMFQMLAPIHALRPRPNCNGLRKRPTEVSL